MNERRFFIRQGDKVQGPFEVERVRGWIASGRVRPDMELSEDGRTFQRGDQFEGLFDPIGDAVAVEARPPTAMRRRREADDEAESTRHLGSASRPPPAPSLLVIGCRLLAVIGLVVALVVGQWAHVVQAMNDPKAPGAESRLVFGLTEFAIGASLGSESITLATLSYASIQPGQSIGELTTTQAASVDAARTSRTYGWVIGGLVVAAALLAAVSFGGAFGNSRLSSLATFALLVSALASIGGWVFMRSGLVARFASDAGRMGGAASAPASTTGGFSLYTVILALLLLGIGEAKSRVASVDDSRRRKARRAPKRR